MPSTYSNLKIELIATGEQSGTWGATTNTNLGTAIEEAITGSADVTFTNGNDTTITLTDVNTTQAARNLRLNLIGSSTGAQNLILGSGCQIEKLYLVNNTLGHTITVKNTTGTGIAVPAGRKMAVYNDGTNVVNAIDYFSSLNVQITGGTIDNTVIGGSTPAAGTFTQVNIPAQGDLRLEDTTGGEYVALQAPGTLASSYTLTLPVDDGTNGQALITDGSGNLSWSTAASGDVYGPASATDNAIARFDLTTGKLIQNSSALVDDSGNVLAGAGTVSVPAFSTTGDTNTGIFFPAADTIAFTEGGVEAMRIDSNGNVAIGTTLPIDRLTVGNSGTSDILSAYRLNNSVGNLSGIVFSLNNSTPAKVNYSAIYGGITSNTAASESGFTAFYTINTGTFAERMRITSAGVALVGKTATGLTTQGIQLIPSGSSAFTGPSGSVPLYINNIGTSSQSLIEFRTGTAGTTVPGSITTDGTNLAINGYTNLIFGTNFTTERMRIDSSGNVLVGITSARANAGDVQVSKGISFPATQSAQSDANTLDDYEEGTWTPVVADAATGGNASATTCYGTYTKIGRIVTITCAAPNINTTGLTAGNLVFIRGLPFSSGDISGATAYYVGQTLTSSITVDEIPLVYLEDSTKTSVNFADSGSILVSDLSSGIADIYFTLTYQTS